MGACPDWDALDAPANHQRLQWLPYSCLSWVGAWCRGLPRVLPIVLNRSTRRWLKQTRMAQSLAVGYPMSFYLEHHGPSMRFTIFPLPRSSVLSSLFPRTHKTSSQT